MQKRVQQKKKTTNKIIENTGKKEKCLPQEQEVNSRCFEIFYLSVNERNKMDIKVLKLIKKVLSSKI